MKKSLFLLLFVIPGIVTQAQKLVPKIKNNTVISYTVTQNGQDAPLVLTINNLKSPLKMQWDINGYGTGFYEMPDKSLESGKSLSSSFPDPDVLTRLASYQTVACISKAAYTDMIKNQEFNYDDLKFSVVKSDTTGFSIDNHQLDVTHAVATNGKGEMWILNNPDFPLVCKTKDSTQGVDYNLVSIK